ncbi:hypothetical protein [Xenorhabdus griffiniae]|uniref:Uncharacterized protein n=1 Tax=Xenorhabdus griffiniae TaxID=351672 RepID=A0ABY9XFE5_9GAMM|nr:hypothetical protein [Xenorhabdus griffiniae]MBD1229574.1 hypothetical protein [Xenorhabdus griffiniae]MBE8589396.1 hypothetical protein [Xenorhabdus griffiniae]WMV71646.1 hypothetical protein QL128_16110 [Xenorhabdus griffiniae]WMV73561.1 hypothetical protein QL128_05935 [Xenorhabdus griffiniae]WNH01323.1 hypothetical protein QL112_016115 [Xenorhabdus griffiniae]
MTHQFHNAVLKDDAQASVQERQLYGIKKAVAGLVEFVTVSLAELGIDKLHEITDPSLDDLADIVSQLSHEAKQHDDLNLQQILLIAQMLINDIKIKNPEMCANSAMMLKKSPLY